MLLRSHSITVRVSVSKSDYVLIDLGSNPCQVTYFIYLIHDWINEKIIWCGFEHDYIVSDLMSYDFMLIQMSWCLCFMYCFCYWSLIVFSLKLLFVIMKGVNKQSNLKNTQKNSVNLLWWFNAKGRGIESVILLLLCVFFALCFGRWFRRRMLMCCCVKIPQKAVK